MDFEVDNMETMQSPLF